MVPDSQKKMLIELFEDGIIAPLKQKGLKQFEISKFLESRANKAKKDPRIYDGTYKTLFEENPVTHEILNWKPEEYQSFVNNVDLFNQHLPTDIIKEFGGLHEVFVPGNGVYSKNIGGHYKDPLSANISLGYTGIPDIKNPQIIEITNTKKINGKPRKFNDLLDFQKSSAYKNAIEDNENLQTIIYGNVMDPLPGHTIATRNPGIIYIKKGNKLINKWKPKQ